MHQDWIESYKLSDQNIANINANIETVITNNSIHSNTKNTSTTGPLCYQYELMPFIDELNFIQDLTQIASKIVSEKELLHSNEKLEPCALWSVTGHEGTFHKIHRHNTPTVRHYSMVIYTKIIENTDTYSGAFYAVLNHNGENDFIEFSPEEGEILLFPVWLCHGTYPQTNKMRTTLNIDFRTVSC